ncbi:MAG: hypothetical protein AAFY76_00885 [Cyanobacteria bacterium J06649_11]
MEVAVVLSLIIFAFGAFTYLILIPLQGMLHHVDLRISAYDQFVEKMLVFWGFICIGRLISAVRVFIPSKIRLSTFRRFRYGSRENFIRFYVTTSCLILFSRLLEIFDTFGLGFFFNMILGATVLYAVVSSRFYSIYEKIHAIRRHVDDFSELLGKLSERERENIELLKKAFIPFHPGITEELVNHNLEVLKIMKKAIGAEKIYLLDSLEDIYVNLLEYFEIGGPLKPQMVLFKENFADELKRTVMRNLEQI